MISPISEVDTPTWLSDLSVVLSTNSLYLQWNDTSISTEVGYTIYRDSLPIVDSENNGTSKSLTDDSGDLQAGTVYNYTIVAYSNLYTSSPSSVLQICTSRKPALPFTWYLRRWEDYFVFRTRSSYCGSCSSFKRYQLHAFMDWTSRGIDFWLLFDWHFGKFQLEIVEFIQNVLYYSSDLFLGKSCMIMQDPVSDQNFCTILKNLAVLYVKQRKQSCHGSVRDAKSF